MERRAFATLATDDRYAKFAVVLGQSMHEAGITAERVCLTSSSVSPELRSDLTKVGFVLLPVESVDSPPKTSDLRGGKSAYTKLQCWRLTDYDKIVFLDADVLVLRNIEELFDYDELTAPVAPAAPFAFQAALMVLKPSLSTFEQMLSKLGSLPSFDDTVQGFFNAYFHRCWRPLPYYYLFSKTSFYPERTVWFTKRYADDLKAIHFSEGKPGELGWHWKNKVIGPGQFYVTLFEKIYRKQAKNAAVRVGRRTL